VPRLLGYVLIHLQGLLLCVIWMSRWSVTLKEVSSAEDGEIWVTFSFALFSVVGASSAALLLVGVFATCVVLYSLIGPLFDLWMDRDLVRWVSYGQADPCEVWGEAAPFWGPGLKKYWAVGFVLAVMGLMASSNQFWLWLHN
jgi:hypothetical protein